MQCLIHDHQMKYLNTGFTLIEMVLTLIIISIVSAAVLPKFFDASGLEEYAYRAESISVLRAIQQKAMQNTQTSQCHRVFISDKILGDFNESPCGVSSPPVISSWSDNLDENTSVVITQTSVSYQVGASGQYFEFDNLGRPACVCKVDIVIRGAESLTIRIEAQGYIHAL